MSAIAMDWSWGYPVADDDAKQLGRLEQAVVCAAADALFPPGGPIPLSGTEAGLLQYFDAYLERSQPRTRFLMRLLLVFIELSPLTFGPRRRRFTRLTPAEQRQLLDDMSKSSIYFRRVSFVSLRALFTMAYLANDRVARAMGMTPNTDPFGIGEGES